MENTSAMDRIRRSPEEITQSRVRTLLTSGMSEGFCIDTLAQILREEYGVTKDASVLKEQLQQKNFELFRDTSANSTLNTEQLTAVTNRVMDVINEIVQENEVAIPVTSANDDAEASGERAVA